MNAKSKKDKQEEASQEVGQESQEEVLDTPTPSEPKVVKIAPEVTPKVLKDPKTGAPLRNQHPGVPDSPWVNKHRISDMDGGAV